MCIYYSSLSIARIAFINHISTSSPTSCQLYISDDGVVLVLVLVKKGRGVGDGVSL
jgi:hypothetical protein